MAEGDYRNSNMRRSEDDGRGGEQQVSQSSSNRNTARRSASRPSVKASGARMSSWSGEARTSGQRPARSSSRAATGGGADADAPTSGGSRVQRSSDVIARQGQAHHHLLRNTTYSARDTRDSSGTRDTRDSRSIRTPSSREAGGRRSTEGTTRRSASTEGRGGNGAGSGALGALGGVLERIGSALGSAWERVSVALDRLPFPKVYLAIALGAIVVAIIIAVAVSQCSAPATEEQASSSEGEQQQQQEDPTAVINADIPEDLRWRDSDFAVDPARTTWKNSDNGEKVVYLTIDDGPSDLTEQMLDLLDKYDVKATFFVTGHDPNYYPLIHEAYKRGHTIGLHSMTHQYDTVYASQEAYFSDLDQVGQVVKDQIGYVPCFIRFPGGSSNTQADGYSPGLMPKIIAEVLKRGYQYYDWNVDSGDGSNLSAEQMVQLVKDTELDTNMVLLCHDSATKQDTLEALPQIIEYYQGLGYSFKAIDRDTWTCHHAVVGLDTDDDDDAGTAAATAAAAGATAAAAGAAAAATTDENATNNEDYEQTDEYYDETYTDDGTYEEEYYDETYSEDDGTGEEAVEEVYVDEDGDYV